MGEILVRAGADINAVNRLGATPLHSAVFFCNKSAVLFLLEKGARRDLKDSRGMTPLSLAKQKECPDIVEVLEASTK